MVPIIYKGKNMSCLACVAEENRDLLTRLDKMDDYITSDMFDELDAEDKALLLLQSSVMLSYSNVLDIRLKRGDNG